MPVTKEDLLQYLLSTPLNDISVDAPVVLDKGLHRGQTSAALKLAKTAINRLILSTENVDERDCLHALASVVQKIPLIDVSAAKNPFNWPRLIASVRPLLADFTAIQASLLQRSAQWLMIERVSSRDSQAIISFTKILYFFLLAVRYDLSRPGEVKKLGITLLSDEARSKQLTQVKQLLARLLAKDLRPKPVTNYQQAVSTLSNQVSATDCAERQAIEALRVQLDACEASLMKEIDSIKLQQVAFFNAQSEHLRLLAKVNKIFHPLQRPEDELISDFFKAFASPDEFNALLKLFELSTVECKGWLAQHAAWQSLLAKQVSTSYLGQVTTWLSQFHTRVKHFRQPWPVDSQRLLGFYHLTLTRLYQTLIPTHLQGEHRLSNKNFALRHFHQIAIDQLSNVKQSMGELGATVDNKQLVNELRLWLANVGLFAKLLSPTFWCACITLQAMLDDCQALPALSNFRHMQAFAIKAQSSIYFDWIGKKMDGFCCLIDSHRFFTRRPLVAADDINEPSVGIMAEPREVQPLM